MSGNSAKGWHDGSSQAVNTNPDHWGEFLFTLCGEQTGDGTVTTGIRSGSSVHIGNNACAVAVSRSNGLSGRPMFPSYVVWRFYQTLMRGLVSKCSGRLLNCYRPLFRWTADAASPWQGAKTSCFGSAQPVRGKLWQDCEDEITRSLLCERRVGE